MTHSLKKRPYFSYDAVFAVLLTGAVIYYLFTCSYGISLPDEAYYAAVTARLASSAAYFTDEWHTTQMFTFLLIAPMKLCLKIFGGTDGIYFHIRIFFVIWHALMSGLIYKVFRKNKLFAVGAAMLYMMYIPENMFAFSYYSLGIDSMLITAMLMYTYAVSEKKHKRWIFTAGLFFAAAVLSEPFLVLMFAAVFAGVIIYFILRKINSRIKNTETDSLLNIKNVAIFCAGLVPLALAFFIYVFSKSSVAEVISVADYILSDSDVDVLTIFSMQEFAQKILGMFLFAELNPIPSVMWGALILITVLDRKRAQHPEVYFVGAFICFIAFHISIYASRDMMNAVYSVFPFVMLGIEVSVIGGLKGSNKVRIFFMIPGTVFFLIRAFVSNTGSLAASQTLLLACVGASVLLCGFSGKQETGKVLAGIAGKQSPEEKYGLLRKITAILIVLVFPAQIIMQVTIASADCCTMEYYSDRSMTYTTIEEGPLKNIRTSEFIAEKCEAMRDDVLKIQESGCKKLCVISSYYWLYLVGDMEISTPSVWWGIAEWDSPDAERFNAYYDLYPEKAPECVYISYYALLSYFENKELAEKVRDDMLNIFPGATVEEASAGFVIHTNVNAEAVK